jgi:hypothetical protein
MTEKEKRPLRQIEFTPKKFPDRPCRIRRVTDGEFRELMRQAIALSDSDNMIPLQMGPERMELAPTYASCLKLFGARGKLFDAGKGGFSFPLTLDIESVSQQPAYLLNLFNYRSGVQFSFYQRVSPLDPRLGTNAICAHDERELTTDDLDIYVYHFVGYLKGFLQGYTSVAGWSIPFWLTATSELILFGYDPNEGFFEHQYPDIASYDNARQEYAQRLPTPNYFE